MCITLPELAWSRTPFWSAPLSVSMRHATSHAIQVPVMPMPLATSVWA